MLVLLVYHASGPPDLPGCLDAGFIVIIYRAALMSQELMELMSLTTFGELMSSTSAHELT